MKETSNLYFIAIIPPDTICNELTGFKEDFAKRFNSKKALRIIPHITLKIPFRLAESEHDALIAWFKGLKLNIRPFTVTLNGFGSFSRRGQPIVFVQPMPSDMLANLQKNLIANMEID